MLTGFDFPGSRRCT